MSETLIARRYAEALFDFATSNGTVEQVDGDMAALSDLVSASRELGNFLKSPVISREQKAAVLRRLFDNRLGVTALRFLDQLVEKRRENILSEVLAQYRDLRDDQLGISRAYARCAMPLSDSERDNVRSALENMTGKKIRLDVDTDSSLIGGTIIKIGDTVYDGSVRNKLNHLREQFTSGTHRTN